MISERQIEATVLAIKESADSDSLGMWKHPLYVGFPLPDNVHKLGGDFDEFKHFSIERIVRRKLEIRAESLRKRDFYRYVFMGTERPFRLESLIFLTNSSYLDYESKEYNELLRNVWVDCEHPHINDAYWRILFAMADREKILDEDGQQGWRLLYAKAKMASEQCVDIYRGTSLEELSVGRKALGLSWTTDYKTAVWFANRWATQDKRPVVLKQRVEIGDLIGPFTERGEHEVILLDPTKGVDFTASVPKSNEETSNE